MIHATIDRIAFLMLQSRHHCLCFAGIRSIPCAAFSMVRSICGSIALAALFFVRLQSIAYSSHVQTNVEDPARHGGREMLDSERADAVEDNEGVEKIESSVIVGLHRNSQGPEGW